jgi:hypothetical protein
MPPGVITDLTGTAAIIGPGGYTYPLTGGAFTSDPLLATDNTGLLPPGWTWEVTVALDGSKPYSYPILIPSTPDVRDLDCLEVNSSCMSGSALAPPAGDIGGTAADPEVVSTHLAAPLPVAQGGTGSATGAAAVVALGAAALTGARFTGATAPAAAMLTDAAVVKVNAAAGNMFLLVCTADVGATRELDTPVNPADGQQIDIVVTQPAAGGPCALTFSDAYLFTSGLAAPTLTVTAGYGDFLRFVYSAALAGWLFIACVQGFLGNSPEAPELRRPVQPRTISFSKGRVP